MGMFKGTSPSKVGGSSMYFPMEKGDNASMWSSWGKGVNMNPSSGKMPTNPGMNEQRNSKKSHDCPFCGG